MRKTCRPKDHRHFVIGLHFGEGRQVAASAGRDSNSAMSTQSRQALAEMEALFATLRFDVLPQFLDSRSSTGDQAVRALPEYRLSVDPTQISSEIPPD